MKSVDKDTERETRINILTEWLKANHDSNEPLTIFLLLENEISTNIARLYACMRDLYQESVNVCLKSKLQGPLTSINIIPTLSESPSKLADAKTPHLEIKFYTRPTLKFTKLYRRQFDCVAIGGTFDHLHSGHKLMLSMALLLSREKLVCGLTTSQMLSNKTHSDQIQPWAERRHACSQFMQSFLKANHNSKDSQPVIEFVELNDPFGPTINDPTIEALIVSPETEHGAEIINEKRIERGLEQLEIISIDLIDLPDGSGKLGSTLIRSLLADRL